MYTVAGKAIACIKNPLISILPSDKPKACCAQHRSVGSDRHLLHVLNWAHPIRFCRTLKMEDLGLPVSYPGEVAVQEAQPDTTFRICHDPARSRHLWRGKLFLDFEIVNAEKNPSRIAQSLNPDIVFDVLRDSNHHPGWTAIILVNRSKCPVLINVELVVDANPELSGVILEERGDLTSGQAFASPNRRHAILSKSIETLSAANPHGAVARGHNAVHFGSAQSFTTRKRGNTLVAEEIEPLGCRNPQVAFTILIEFENASIAG